MTSEQQAAFEAERRSMIGGSDIHAMLNLEPWGCAHRLWLQKRGVEPDRPEDENKADFMRRGQICEELVVSEYVRKTGRKLIRQSLRRHRDYPYIGVHQDRRIVKDPRGPGVLECKTVGQRQYWDIFKTGAPEGYLLQVQWALGVTGAKWGSFAILWLDGWKLLWYDVPRNDALIADLFLEAHTFWPKIENGPAPDKLQPSDRRCAGCVYANTCHGDAFAELLAQKEAKYETDHGIAPLVQRVAEARQIAKEADELKSAEEAELQAALGQRTHVQTLGYKVMFPAYEGGPTADPKKIASFIDRHEKSLTGEQTDELRAALGLGRPYRKLNIYPSK